VSASEPLDSPNSVWFHEYVHTRQAFEVTGEMRWFREASAEYYAARLAFEQDRIDRAAMETHLDGPGRRATLADPTTWRDERVPYTKGARVLALLDRTIRTSTDGERSLETVFRRLNAHEGPVSYADFERIVADVAGHSMDRWLDRYVRGPTPVASFYASEPARVGVIDVFAAGLDGGQPDVVVALVATLSAVAASLVLYAYLRRLDAETFGRAAGRL
jgi:predicted metalloprotease with PDZ domain